MPRFRTTSTMPWKSLSEYREGEAPDEPQEGENSMLPAAQQELRPPNRSVTDVVDEASRKPGIPTMETERITAEDDMTSVEQTPSVPSAGVLASDRMFVRENPW